MLSLALLRRPDNGGTMPSEKHAFERTSILFRPLRSPLARIWWRRRVLPPGPKRLLHMPFIAIAGQAGTSNIVTLHRRVKVGALLSNSLI